MSPFYIPLPLEPLEGTFEQIYLNICITDEENQSIPTHQEFSERAFLSNLTSSSLLYLILTRALITCTNVFLSFTVQLLHWKQMIFGSKNLVYYVCNLHYYLVETSKQAITSALSLGFFKPANLSQYVSWFQCWHMCKNIQQQYVNVFHQSSRETYLLCTINCGNGANCATDSSGNFEKVLSVKKQKSCVDLERRPGFANPKFQLVK